LKVRPKVLLPVRSDFKDWLLPENTIRELEESFELEVVVDPAKLSKKEYVDLFRGREAVLSTWNMPFFDREVIGAMDRLKIISHCGGEVRPCLGEEIFDLKPDLLICNTSNVMSKPVAEYALTVTLCLLRNLIHFKEWVRHDQNWWEYDLHKNVSLLQKKVGIVGLGQIAREFIKLVRPFDVELLVYNGYLSDEEARKEKLVKASLEQTGGKTPQPWLQVDNEKLEATVVALPTREDARRAICLSAFRTFRLLSCRRTHYDRGGRGCQDRVWPPVMGIAAFPQSSSSSSSFS
jgi:hypothetical protein